MNHHQSQQKHSNPHKKILEQKSPSFLIREHISQGSLTEAFLIYKQIRSKGTYVLNLLPLILKAWTSASMLKHGKSFHGEAIKNGADSDIIIGTSLINMYAKCGAIFDSRKLFDLMPERNVITWNAMVGGLISNGDMESASYLFDKMSTRTAVTWIEMIHGFSKTGDLITAKRIFDQVPTELKNVVTWTVMVDGYATKGSILEARALFEDMPEKNFFAWSSIISGYFRIGDVKEAKSIFDRIPVKNLVNWNSLISGYAQHGFCEEVLEAFEKMQEDGFEPDEITVVSVLSACAQLGLLDFGKDVHWMVYRKSLKLNQFVMNSLVDMYAKCGDLPTARSIFDGMTHKNKSCWNSMISGFAIHGQCKEALEFFRRMEESSEKPDEITFLSILSACAHGGFVDEGLEIFFKMEKRGVVASVKHYGCMVDLLGRAGRLQDAYNLIKEMPVTPNDAVWGALLGACRVHLDMDTVNRVMNEINGQSCRDDSHFVLLSNIYAASDSWEKAERMRIDLTNKGLKKITGRSSFMLAYAEE